MYLRVDNGVFNKCANFQVHPGNPLKIALENGTFFYGSAWVFSMRPQTQICCLTFFSPFRSAGDTGGLLGCKDSDGNHNHFSPVPARLSPLIGSSFYPLPEEEEVAILDLITGFQFVNSFVVSVYKIQCYGACYKVVIKTNIDLTCIMKYFTQQ